MEGTPGAQATATLPLSHGERGQPLMGYGRIGDPREPQADPGAEGGVGEGGANASALFYMAKIPEGSLLSRKVLSVRLIIVATMTSHCIFAARRAARPDRR